LADLALEAPGLAIRLVAEEMTDREADLYVGTPAFAFSTVLDELEGAVWSASHNPLLERSHDAALRCAIASAARPASAVRASMAQVGTGARR
jgi:hypothetical protein